MRYVLLVLLIAVATIAADEAAPKQIDLAQFDAQIKPDHRLHWSFQPVRRPPVPAVKNAAWVRNPIDAFVLAKLEEAGWQPAAAVPPATLFRRMHLDVFGLPPTPEEVDAFVEECRILGTQHSVPQSALAKLADRLLASPHYGERWGRHWLDVVRYAETCGYERDAAKPHVWRYRDYVIRAFNDDKPFDRFILEQLAGDELPDSSADTLVATGFLRLGPWDDEPADPQEDRFDQLDDLVNATSLVFMGLTLSCCRCHDHKFDALTMHDYYRLVAVFDPLERPREGRSELDLPIGDRASLERQKARDRKIAEIVRRAPAGKPLPQEAAEQVAALKRETPDLPRGYFLHEPASPPDTHLLIRGKAARPGPKVAPGMPAVLVDRQPPFPAPADRSTDGTTRRRLTFARWLADPEHPLTARVIVNRVWHYHFGEGLVRTPNDFGILGQPPTHPELLDWLAADFIAHGWSLKHLHRRILTSSTYQMSKRVNPDYAAKDPENALLWRFPYKRLEAEVLRDSVLAVSGQLNRAMYGPSMYPDVPKEALTGHSDPDKIWKPLDERAAARRTVYAFMKRTFVVPLLETFDLCDTTRPNDRRQITTVAPQALMLFNGAFVNRQAKRFADRLRCEAGDDPERQIERAYRLALGRAPHAPEKARLREFLRDESLEQLCRVVFNLNEFAYAD
jgi:hypothetical protein